LLVAVALSCLADIFLVGRDLVFHLTVFVVPDCEIGRSHFGGQFSLLVGGVLGGVVVVYHGLLVAGLVVNFLCAKGEVLSPQVFPQLVDPDVLLPLGGS
jgi:hypothetical protein